MSQISLKSISGITSITTPAGVDNQLTVHTNDTTEVMKVTSSGLNVTGVVTATSFSGSGANLTGIDATTVKDSSGNIRVSGTPAGAVVSGVLTATNYIDVKQSGNAYINLLSTGTGNAGLYMDASNGDISGSDYCSLYQKNDLDFAITNRKNTANIIFETGGENERLRIDSSGNLLIGDSAGQIGKLSTLGTGNHISAIRHSTDASSANFLFAKYRGSRSSPAIIVNGDALGDVAWYGYNGSSIIKAASISASASSTVDGSNMPTDLIFKTTSGNTNTERFRIASDGKLTVAGTGAIRIPAGTTGQRSGSSVAGDIRYNSTNSTLEFYTGSAWIGTNAAPSINTVTGEIYNGVSGRTLVINCNDISASGNDVKYSNNSNGSVIATDTSASTSGSNITSTIPANVYNTAAGTVIKIEVINSAGTLSSNSVTKTILAAPSGGTKTSAGGYWYHTFTSSGNFVNTIASLSVEYLVVAGGGGGGGNQGGGGGGAGGYRTGSATLSAATYAASIGGGGGNGGNGNSGYGSDGGNSSFNGLTSTGGGGGANMNTSAQAVNGRSGGSGSGGSHWLNGSSSGGSGTSGQGNNGGGGLDTESLGHNGGAGGGASGAGSNGQNATGGNGGNGTTWSNGTTYAGGGGGGCYYNNNSGGNSQYSIGGGAGTGGGGRGTRNTGANAAAKLSSNYSAPTTDQNGVDGYGGGGGGGGGNPGDGGDGVVIIRYQL